MGHGWKFHSDLNHLDKYIDLYQDTIGYSLTYSDGIAIFLVDFLNVYMLLATSYNPDHPEFRAFAKKRTGVTCKRMEGRKTVY